MTINSHWEHQATLNEIHKLRMTKDTWSSHEEEQYQQLLLSVSSFERRYDPLIRLLDVI